MMVNLKKVNQSHYTRHKTRIVYTQIGQWLCIFSCTFCILREQAVVFFSITSIVKF